MESPNYYAIIPANVRYDQRLKPSEKLLYGEITALSNKKGYCFASNGYFAKLYNVAKETVSRWISNLIKFGYIESEINYKNGSKEIEQRVLFILSIPNQKKVKPSPQKKVDPPIDKKVKDNNTSINNTRYNISAKQNFGTKSYIDKIIEAYKNAYFQKNNVEYLSLTTDKKAAGLFAKHFKTVFPDNDTQEMEAMLESIFNEILSVKGRYLKENTAKMLFVAENINQYFKNIKKVDYEAIAAEQEAYDERGFE